MKQFKQTALSIAVAQVALLCAVQAHAQAQAPAADKKDDKKEPAQIVVTGQRGALQSAQKIKRDADEIVDAIVADDIGRLPDRSVTEVLQRIVGVTMDRTMSRSDPEHFSVEGSGVVIRGLTYVRSELNGRDSFSANDGRSLSFEDVPPELLAAVEVYKNPSAEQVEGAIGGLVNLRTAMPFDNKEFKGVVSLGGTYSDLRKKWSPQGSGLLSKTWTTDAGKFGALIHVARSESATRTDSMQVDAYYPTDTTSTKWFPKSLSWRTMEYNRERNGLYGALQWKKNDLESSLTYFHSKYKFDWNENAIFTQNNVKNTVITNAEYSPSGALLRGTLTNPTDGGVAFDTDTRFADRQSDTQDLSWNLRWKASNKWTFSTDVQYIRSKTRGFDSTVATGLQMPQENIDLTGKFPRINFTASDLAYLADPAHYYWAFTMENIDESKATQKAWRGDAKYTFETPGLVDLRFGLRLTDRDGLSQNSNPFYHWATVTHPWQLGWNVDTLSYLSRFGKDMAYLHQFNNFMGGKQQVPNLWVPTYEAARGYPDSYTKIHGFYDTLCKEFTDKNGWGTCSNFAWNPSTFGTDPAFTNDQRERTQAAYAQLRFDLDDFGWPVDGNVGLRLVRTEAKANGYTTMTVKLPTLPDNLPGVVQAQMPQFNFTAEKGAFDQSTTFALPSLNMRFKGSNGWQYRAAFSKGLSRPDFKQLQASTVLTADSDNHVAIINGVPTVVIDQLKLTGEAKGNPNLKPIGSRQIDVTAEWDMGKGNALTFAAFDKQLKDIIVNQTFIKQIADTTGKVHNFVVTGPVNGAKGYARGMEVDFKRYFDLPGWLSGFGMQANYTYVDSKQKRYNAVYNQYCTGSSGGAANLDVNINGCDTNGRSYADLPLANLSKHTYNLALLYDQGPWSAKIAYNFRSKYLYGVNMPGTNATDGLDTNCNGTNTNCGQYNIAWGVPLWADGFGQVDGSISYRFNDQFQIGLEAKNLNNGAYKQLMQQQPGMMGRYWYMTGRAYTLSGTYSF